MRHLLGTALFFAALNAQASALDVSLVKAQRTVEITSAFAEVLTPYTALIVSPAFYTGDKPSEEVGRKVCFEMARIEDHIQNVVQTTDPQAPQVVRDTLKDILIDLAKVNMYCAGSQAPDYGLPKAVTKVLNSTPLPNLITPGRTPELARTLQDLSGSVSRLNAFN